MSRTHIHTATGGQAQANATVVVDIPSSAAAVIYAMSLIIFKKGVGMV